jgi:hypothetical protein
MDVVFYCASCRNGYRLDNRTNELISLEVTFVSRPNLVADTYKPFWLIPADVWIDNREAKGGGFSGLLGRFFGGEQAVDQRASGVFAVPAFRTDIDRTIELTRRYTSELPEITQRLGERLVGGCFDVEDAHKIVHYAVIATEVDKPDLLLGLRYRMQFGEPKLLGVPFLEQAGTIKDAFFHTVI